MCRAVIERVTRLLEEPRVSDTERERKERIAVAALMVECARVDTRFSDRERRRIVDKMEEIFELADDEADMLLAIAEERAGDVWHDWLFTQAITRGFDSEARAELMSKLCDVALSNDVIHRHEETFLRRIARELRVPESVVDVWKRGIETDAAADPE